MSALCLGVYDIFKKLSLKDNNVLTVLFFNTLFSALLMSPVIIAGVAVGDWGFGNTLRGHMLIALKSVIVLSSWIMGYFSIKHLPLTIAGPVNASRPVMVLVGALIVFGERLNGLQWTGIVLGFFSLFLISRAGSKEGFSLRESRWLWLALGAALMGAVSALYDKFLLRRFEPLQVQAWYSFYQLLLMGTTVSVIKRMQPASHVFSWRWTIPCISIFLTVADIAYFYALSLPGAMISIISMIRRGSVIVTFAYGVIALGERNIRDKLADLAILLVSLTLLVIGSGL